MIRSKIKYPESITTAHVPINSRMERNELSGVNVSWKGFIATSDNKMVNAYVKRVKDDSELYREILCSLLARAINIPSPQPLVVEVPAGHPQIPSNGKQLFFGSIDCESPSFSRFLIDTEQDKEILLSYEDIHKIVCFDELIANYDRHDGNILFNGIDYNFIDHGNTFPSDLQPCDTMIQSEYGTNQLADIVNDLQGQNDVKTKVFMNKVDAYIKRETSKQQIELLPTSCSISPAEMNKYHTRIQGFLLSRLPILAQLVGFGVSSSDKDGQLNLVL